MLKGAGLFLVLAGCMGGGFCAGRDLSLREKNLRQFLHLVTCLEGEIKYGNSSLKDAFEKAAGRAPGPVGELFYQLAEELGSVEKSTLEQLLGGKLFPEIQKFHFTEEEQEFLISLGSRMGYPDRETQIRQLKLYEEELRRHIEEVHETISDKKKIYRGLGIMGGFLIVIFLW